MSSADRSEPSYPLLPAAPGQPREAEVTRALPTTPPRFAQLTHASFHAADGFGGWQVKESTGEITPDEERLLQRRTAKLPVGQVPAFLTPEEVDRLPRRLVYGPVDPARPGPAAYWHAVPAGLDSSGRPGNVFTHVVLDRRPETARPALRPGDLLGSPVWLRPYGDEQVRRAAVTDRPDPPWPAPVLGRAAVLEFLVRKALWRGGTLRGLLDAVHAALRGGPPVVLGVDDEADAERWVAAVGHLMSPGTARRLYFSTAEHVGGLAAARSAGLHLITVPAAELRAAEPDGPVVLISDEDLVDGATAVAFVDYDVDLRGEQVHTTAYGSRIRATPWSVIAGTILHDAVLATALLDRQDAIAAEVGDRDLDCAWPLALAVVEHALDHPGTSDAGALEDALPAARVVVQTASPDILGAPLQQVVQRLREETLGSTAADSWAALQGPLPPGVDPHFARGVYLRRALQDRGWLLRDGGVPLPDLHGVAGRLGDTIVAQVHAAVGAERVPGGEPAAVILRLLDLVARVGLAGRFDPAWLDDVLDRLVGPVLLHPVDGPGLIERVGPLDEGTQSRIVRPWLDQRLPRLPGRPGCRLGPLVLRWLFREPPTPDPYPSPTVVEAALQATLVLGDPSAFRPAALTAELGGKPSAFPTRAALGPGLPVGAVLALLDRVEPSRLADVLAPTLLSAPAGSGLDTLLRRVGPVDRPGWDTPAGRAVQQAVQLRTLEAGWMGPAVEGDRTPAYRRLAQRLRPLVAERVPLAADLLASGAAADVVDRVEGLDESAGRPLVEQYRPGSMWADSDVMMALARRVAEAVRNGATTDQRLVLAAQLGAHPVDGVALGPASWRDVAELTWTTPAGRQPRLLDHVVYLRLQELQQAGPDELERLIAAVRHWVEQAVDEHPDRPDPHRALAGYDRVALAWWPLFGLRDDDVRRVLRRRAGRWSP